MSDIAVAPELELTQTGLCAQLAVCGELDLASVGAVESLLDRIPLHAGAVLLVDLGACTFIDSSIIALLLRWRERAIAARAELVVLVGTGTVAATLDTAGVAELLAVVRDGDGRVPGG